MKDTDKEKKNQEKDSKNERTFYFMNGLPRSGSTILANLLAQNPRIHTTGTSAVRELMLLIRDNWDNFEEIKANPNESARLRVIRGVLENFYSDIEKPIVVDKCRAWLSRLEMLETALGHNVKVIVTVRDIRDVLASFEKLWRITSETRQVRQEKNNKLKFLTMEGRANVWLQNDQPLGVAYNNIKDAVDRGYRDRLLFIDYDKFTKNPKEQMKRLYDFLGEEYFEHDFDNVEQVIHEDDSVHGFTDLHKIKTKIESKPPQWPKILGDFAEKHEKLNFWEDYI
jgi:sulfotransferase